MNSTTTKIYNEARTCLGQHITLNSNIPNDVGCAEAVSFVLKNAGIIGIPVAGFPGTAGLYQWLLANPVFTHQGVPTQGAILVSPTGYGNGTIEGHTGIVGGFAVEFPNEYGILSNNSDNGLFQEKWNLLTWWEYYGRKGGLPLAFFVAK